MLNKVIERIKKQGIDLEITEKAKEIIIKNGTDYKYGARPLRRTIQNLVEDKIAEEILSENLKDNNKMIIDEKDERIIVI